MSASELTFLVSGLVLGIVSGAALIEVLRARPPAPREVRVTVAADAVPRRRAATLSDDAFAPTGPEAARGGPADRRTTDVDVMADEVERRTAVRSGPTAISIQGGVDPVLAALRSSALPALVASGVADAGRQDEPKATVDDARLVPSIRATARLALEERPPTASMAGPPGAGSSAGAPGERSAGGTSAGGGLHAPGDLDPTDRCAGERRIAAERCGLAVRARSGATTSADTVRAAQRSYDEHIERTESATSIADPRAVRREKEAAQARFRASYNGARTTDDAESAARDWLAEINDVNSAARAATAAAKRERSAAAAIAATLERLALEADAARIAAETAEAACLAARQALAECDERVQAGTPTPRAPASPWVERPEPAGDDDEPLAAAWHAGGTPTIFRLVRGDRPALIALVDRLSGDDPMARRRWQASLTGLVDSIVSVSIEAGALEFPPDHPFWGTFTLVQDREISQALSSLGHRFDGLGGFVDDRFPTQRDLSLALGYAGLDPMRIRHWPTEAEMAALYEDVTVAADEHLAGAAGDLSLGELVALLGRRADGLADLWNEWGRVRPFLLEGA